jgi:tRNA pseudouridine13 synthase
MILKQTPEDFLVEELTDVQPGEGPFAFYRLDKNGWTTPDALEAIRRRWRLERRRLSYGGLKDRHAQTVQYFTVYRGPQRRLTHQGFSVTYLGQVARPYLSQEIRSNRFELVLRDVAATDLPSLTQSLDEVRACGVPNYFDDQRFGSVTPLRSRKGPVAAADGESGAGGPFLAKSIMLGQYEEALKLALTAYYPHDRGAEKKAKAMLRGHWGAWARCKELLPRGHGRSLVDYLAQHDGDFRGALERLRPELRGLYLSAYQSYLWNRVLAAWLRAHLRPQQLVNVRLKLGAAPMQRFLAPADQDRLRHLVLPLPSHRVAFVENDERRQFFDQVLAEENITLEQFKLKGFREMFFSRGERPALCVAADLGYTSGPDETHPGKQKLRLAFELPRGSYATLIVKRITEPWQETP